MTNQSGFSRAFILGAGIGTRLRPLTEVLPKPLMPVFQHSLVEYAMMRCRDAGIRNFVINTHHLPDCWTALFGEGIWQDCSLALSHEPVLLDSGGGLRHIKPLIEDDRPLLVLNGDILSTVDLESLMAEHRRSGALVTLALRSSGSVCNVGFDPSSGLVTDIRHGLGIDPGDYQFAGIYCIEPEVLEMIPSDPEVVSIIPTWLELVRSKKVAGIVLDEGMWMDVGSPAMYGEAHRQLPLFMPEYNFERRGKGSVIHPSARVDDETIIGAGASVGEACLLEACIVWPGVSVSAGTSASHAVFMDDHSTPVQGI